MKIKRALLSVSDKTDIVKLAKYLQSIGCEIISTGGTGNLLKENDIKITEIEKITKNPEAFGGRMKTISFEIESAILFDREKDKKEAQSLSIEPIDLVVCNLYPFEKVYFEGADNDVLIENIDIGGPTMIRAAAKNYKYVTVLCNPADYDEFIEKHKQGFDDSEYRYNLMKKAFVYTATYDIFIANAFGGDEPSDTLLFAFDKKKKLRYGENSHQKAFYFRNKLEKQTLYDFENLQGKEVSFNNLADMNAAIEAIADFSGAACSVVKHNNPCGLAVSDNLEAAFKLAWEGDSISAFGSIIAFNKPVDRSVAEFLNLDDKKNKKFVEMLIAPDFSEDALSYLVLNKNLRVIKFNPKRLVKKYDIRYLNGLLLWQETDKTLFDDLRLVTETVWDFKEDEKLIKFGLSAVKSIKSNAIVLVRKKENSMQLLGMGAGQPNRIVATKLAVAKAIENLEREFFNDDFDIYLKKVFNDVILVSDAFFPFADSLEYISEFGIKKVVQPGGSIRDKKVIKRANELGISMIFSGLRHFKH